MIAMPKKLPMNSKKKIETESCKRPGLRTRVLDTKKDCIDQPKCQQWVERYKLELKKESKLGAILSDFHGFMSNNGKAAKRLHNKLSGRPLKCLNMNDSFGKKFNNNSNSQMAVDFDHMYMNCNNSKTSLQVQLELKQLKELNVLHLDIIEQQAEEIVAKEKLIKNLEEDNQNLQARLKRLEKRYSSTIATEFDGLSELSVKTEFCDRVSCSCVKSGQCPRGCLKTLSPRSPQLRNACGREESTYHSDGLLLKKDLSRKCSPRHSSINSSSSSLSLPPLQNKRIPPRETRLRSSSSNLDAEATFTTSLDEQDKKDYHEDSSTKARSPGHKRPLIDESISPSKKIKISFDQSQKLSQNESESTTDHSLRSRERIDECRQLRNHSPEKTPVVVQNDSTLETPNNTFQSNTQINATTSVCFSNSTFKPQTKDAEPRRIRSEGILTTQGSYYLPTQTAAEFDEVLEEDGKETQVEIPKWRIKPFASLYVMEGTENLEDEIFAKRHTKPEHEEKRRKRWDLQRMREQRQYEKLKERYEGRNNTDDSNSQNPQSLWPNAESVQTILIEDSLPVCAFGQLLAKIYESDFTVPWLVGKSPTPVGLSTRRKKR